MKGVAPPDSRYPTLRDGNLVAPTKEAMGFPTIPVSVVGPGWRTTVPEPGFINPVLDYNWGPNFNPSDGSGVPTLFPPPIKQVIKMLVPRVDADGNEMGGVPVVLDDAPLGTYLGWNITDGRTSPPLAQYRPFHGGQLCDYVGGMIPFAKTKAERDATGDPRLSLEERYTDHAGYVEAVRPSRGQRGCSGLPASDRREQHHRPGRRQQRAELKTARALYHGLREVAYHTRRDHVRQKMVESGHASVGASLLLAACVATAFTPAAAQSPSVLRMARNQEPGIFIPVAHRRQHRAVHHGQRLRRLAARDQGRRQRRASPGELVGHVARTG